LVKGVLLVCADLVKRLWEPGVRARMIVLGVEKTWSSPAIGRSNSMLIAGQSWFAALQQQDINATRTQRTAKLGTG
jgi:hypothetical protein